MSYRNLHPSICPYTNKLCKNNFDFDCEHCITQINEGNNESLLEKEREDYFKEGNNTAIFEKVIELVKNIQQQEEELQLCKELIENLKKETKELMLEYGGDV